MEPITFCRTRGPLLRTTNPPANKAMEITWLLQCYGHCLSVPYKQYTPADFAAAIEKNYKAETPATAHALKILEELSAMMEEE